MEAEFYRDLLDSLADGVYFVDTERRVRYWNKAAERLSGYAMAEVLGDRCADKILKHMVVLGGELSVQEYPLAATLDDGRVREAELFLLHKYGYRVPVSVRATPVRDEKGVIVGAAEVFRPSVTHIDVLAELQALRGELLADPLTGVGNRRFAELTQETMQASFAGHGVPYGVIFARIDRLAEMRLRLGEEGVGQVLRVAAQTLSRTLRSLDVVCHWGEGLFTLYAPIATEVMLQSMARRQRVLVESSGLDIGGERVRITASLGGAVSRRGETAADVLVRAEAQLKRSAAAGGNLALVDLGI